MLKLVRQLMKPEKQVFRIEVLNILTPRVMIGTWDSSRIPTSKEYVELERHMSRMWSHAPAWKFPDLPSEGTLVMAMVEHKTNFKRGVVLHVELISNARFYFVFLYDWGILERFTIDDLAQLRAEDEHKLIPRSFFMIHAGMIVSPKKFRSRAQRESGKQVEHETSGFEENDVCENGNSRPNGVNLFEVNQFARNWFDSRDCYMQMYKNFQGIVFICDLRTPMVKANGRVQDVAFAYLMQRKGFTIIDRKLRKQDKDYELVNWDSIVGRLEGIDFNNIIKTKDNISDNRAASCGKTAFDIVSELSEHEASFEKNT